MIMKKWDKLPDVMKTDEVKPYYLALKRKTASLIIKRVFDIIVSLILLILLSFWLSKMSASGLFFWSVCRHCVYLHKPTTTTKKVWT